MSVKILKPYQMDGKDKNKCEKFKLKMGGNLKTILFNNKCNFFLQINKKIALAYGGRDINIYKWAKFQILTTMERHPINKSEMADDVKLNKIFIKIYISLCNKYEPLCKSMPEI